MAAENELTTCGSCGNDLARPGGVTVYYRFGLPGTLGEDGIALQHSFDEKAASVDDATQDMVSCAECDAQIWAE